MYRQGNPKEPIDNQTQKNVDNPQDDNNFDDEEDNTNDLETEKDVCQSILLQ